MEAGAEHFKEHYRNRQESKVLIEKMELEVAERKLSFHNLQEEMHHLLEQLEQAGQAQAESGSPGTVLWNRSTCRNGREDLSHFEPSKI